MALKKCKECGNEVSTKAKTCPKCGAVKKSTANELVKSVCSLILLPPLVYSLWLMYPLYFPTDSPTTTLYDIPTKITTQPKTYIAAPAKLAPIETAPIETTPNLIECPRCKGTGLIKQGVRKITFRKCSRCKGTGIVK